MSFTSPEAVAYFHTIKGNQESEENVHKLIPKSKVSRVASN